MLGIGFLEIVVIAVVCLIVVGPKHLQLMMRKLAGFYREFVALREEFRVQLLSTNLELKEDEKDTEEKQKIAISKETVAREKNHG